MKKVLVPVFFIIAFVIVTAAMYFMNNTFNNIYAFDFSPARHDAAVKDSVVREKKKKPLTAEEKLRQFLYEEIKGELLDSIKSYSKTVKGDTFVILQDKSLQDSIKKISDYNKRLLEETAKLRIKDSLSKVAVIQVNENNKKPDSLYITWTKKTAQLYETMDSKKAAKIILNYSDNVAKDILYAMKKKKAAEILAELSPEAANRITRVR